MIGVEVEAGNSVAVTGGLVFGIEVGLTDIFGITVSVAIGAAVAEEVT